MTTRKVVIKWRRDLKKTEVKILQRARQYYYQPWSRRVNPICKPMLGSLSKQGDSQLWDWEVVYTSYVDTIPLFAWVQFNMHGNRQIVSIG